MQRAAALGYVDPPSRPVRVLSSTEAVGLERDRSARFRFRLPAHWKSPVFRNPHALHAEREVLAWFSRLGCTPEELARAAKFDAAGYVGIPFPGLSPEMSVRIGKYLSMWLLWDDVQIERLESRWRIGAADVLSGIAPAEMSRFDHGWWELLGEFAARRSRRWVEDVCTAMITWNEAAMIEAIAMKSHRDRGVLPGFALQLEMRIATIGMYATVYLLEDTYDYELPRTFHAHPTVRRIKKLANLLVGLGNDIFSLGKDLAEGQINLVSTLLQEEMVSCDQALEQLIGMHDAAIEEFDRLAAGIGSWGELDDRYIARWLQDVRYASLGFTLWEAQAPRYTAHKVVVDDKVLEPDVG